MDTQILIGLLLSVLPISELRGGLPVVFEYCVRNALPIWPYFALVVVLNVLVIFLVFFFLDFLHKHFMHLRFYKRFMDYSIERARKKGKRAANGTETLTYTALALFVAIPLPGTGAWTGTLIAWIFGLNRAKSIIAISLGVIAAGLIVLAALFGLFALL